MRLVGIELENWMCFAGKHTLALEDKVYGIFAQQAGNEDRSNWLGKTAFVEAIRFGLYGKHRKRLEDDWITEGEKFGGVRLDFDDGTKITRVRHRGKKTELFLYLHEGTPQVEALIQDEAQAAIDEIVGLTDEDFVETCFFKQRDMAGFILADPSERMAIISAWLQLGPLERCEEHARKQVKSFVDQASERERQLTLLVAPGTCPTEREVEDAGDDVLRAKRAVVKLQAQVEANLELINARHRVGEFESLVAEGKKLRERLEAADVEGTRAKKEESDRQWEEVVGQASNVKRRLVQAREVAAGNFDGTCPVARIECPARDVINSKRRSNAAALVQVQKEHDELLARQEAMRIANGRLDAALQEMERLTARLETMRERGTKMLEEVERAREAPEPHEPTLLRAQLDAAQAKLEQAIAEYKSLESLRQRHLEAADKQTAIKAEVERIHRENVVPWREAATIFRNAHRKVAEGALTEIEQAANDMLAACGIELRVHISWTRETKNLAKACDQCGAPFPPSKKVTTCTRCGAERGKHHENKMEMSLSDQSGAAEDLGGASIKLGASAWLRAERESGWSVAVLDEPFGQLDRQHRRAFGAHLAAMLRGRYGFDQAFVIAHSPDVLESFPGRIEITSTGGKSSVRVVT